jgi:hypothetical protein
VLADSAESLELRRYVRVAGENAVYPADEVDGVVPTVPALVRHEHAAGDTARALRADHASSRKYIGERPAPKDVSLAEIKCRNRRRK